MTSEEKIEKSKNKRDAKLTEILGTETMAIRTLICEKKSMLSNVEASDLKQFLLNRAVEMLGEPDKEGYGGYADYDISYCENVNPDALIPTDSSGSWLEKRTSYIWAVGVVVCTDWNKCDFVKVFIGQQRDNKGDYDSEPEFVGMLYWNGGENDDIGRCLDRYLKCMRNCHPVFENDREDE